MGRRQYSDETKDPLDVLTGKQRLFVESYLFCWNATQAAREAGYAGDANVHGVIGHENLRNSKIKAAISQRIDEAAMPANEVLFRLAEQARGNMDDFLEGEDLSLPKAKARKKMHLIKKFSRNDGKETTNISVELYDAQAALFKLGSGHGLWLDKVAPTDPTGTKEYAGLTDDERAARIAELLDAARARRVGQSANDKDSGV